MKRNPIGPPCRAYLPGGRICGRPATHLSKLRGCMVCGAHIDAAAETADSPTVGYTVCPRCKAFIPIHHGQPLATSCPKCRGVLATPGPGKEVER